jgi:predicted transcriptional regulator
MDEFDKGRPWTFFTHHAHVLIILSRDPTLRMRDIAVAVGVTERATATLVSELVQTGYLRRLKQGRRNHYQVDLSGSLRHAALSGITVGTVFATLVASQADLTSSATREQTQHSVSSAG